MLGTARNRKIGQLAYVHNFNGGLIFFSASSTFRSQRRCLQCSTTGGLYFHLFASFYGNFLGLRRQRRHRKNSGIRVKQPISDNDLYTMHEPRAIFGW